MATTYNRRLKPSGYILTDDFRKRIAASGVLNDMILFWKGELEKTPLQVQVGIVLLNKIVPSLTATEISGGVDATVTLQRIERVIIDAMPAPQLTIDNDGKDTSVN